MVIEPQHQNHLRMDWIARIISIQCNVLSGNHGSLLLPLEASHTQQNNVCAIHKKSEFREWLDEDFKDWNELNWPKKLWSQSGGVQQNHGEYGGTTLEPRRPKECHHCHFSIARYWKTSSKVSRVQVVTGQSCFGDRRGTNPISDRRFSISGSSSYAILPTLWS